MAALACLALLPHAVMKPYAESMVPSSLGGEATPSMEQRIQQEKAKIHELTALYRSRRASAAVPAPAPASRVARPSRGLRFAARAVALDAIEGSHPRGIVLESFDPAVCLDLPDFRDAKGESCESWAGVACSSATGDSCGYTAEHVAAVWGACRASCGQCSSVSASSSKKMRRLAKLAVHLEQYEGSDLLLEGRARSSTKAAQQAQEQPATLALGPQDGLVKLLSWNTTEDDELTLYASTGDKGTFSRVKLTINGETELVVTNSNSTPSADSGSMMAELHGVTMDGEIINKLTQLKMRSTLETLKEDGTPAATVRLVKYDKKVEAKAVTETITIEIGGTPLVLNSEWPLLEDEEALQRRNVLVDISFPDGLPPHANGPFAELAGQEPMTDQTRRLGLAPGPETAPAETIAEVKAPQCPNSAALEQDAADIAELVLPVPSPSPSPAPKHKQFPPEVAEEEEEEGGESDSSEEESMSEAEMVAARTASKHGEAAHYNTSAMGVSEVFAHLVRHLKHAATDYQESLKPFAATSNPAVLEDSAMRSDLKLKFTLAKHSYAELAAAVVANGNANGTQDKVDAFMLPSGVAALRETEAYLKPGQTWSRVWGDLAKSLDKKQTEKEAKREEMVKRYARMTGGDNVAAGDDEDDRDDSPRAHMLRPMMRRGQTRPGAEDEEDPAAEMAGNMRVGRWQPVLQREHHMKEEEMASHHSIKDASVNTHREPDAITDNREPINATLRVHAAKLAKEVDVIEVGLRQKSGQEVPASQQSARAAAQATARRLLRKSEDKVRVGLRQVAKPHAPAAEVSRSPLSATIAKEAEEDEDDTQVFATPVKPKPELAEETKRLRRELAAARDNMKEMMRSIATKTKNGTAEAGEAERLQTEDKRLLQQLSRIDERTADETTAAASPQESHTMHVDGGAAAETGRAEEVSVRRKERGRAASETLETFAMREIEARLAKAGSKNSKNLKELANDAVSLHGEGGLEGRFANMKSRSSKDKGDAKAGAKADAKADAKGSKGRHAGHASSGDGGAKPGKRMSAEEAYTQALASREKEGSKEAAKEAAAPSAAVALAAKTQSKHRMDPRLRGMAVALAASDADASTPAGNGNEAGATQTHGGPSCVNTGCEHGSESASENWPDGRNACPCPCPCEVDENTNQNLDDRVSPSPPPAILPAGVYAENDMRGLAAFNSTLMKQAKAEVTYKKVKASFESALEEKGLNVHEDIFADIAKPFLASSKPEGKADSSASAVTSTPSALRETIKEGSEPKHGNKALTAKELKAAAAHERRSGHAARFDDSLQKKKKADKHHGEQLKKEKVPAHEEGLSPHKAYAGKMEPSKDKPAPEVVTETHVEPPSEADGQHHQLVSRLSPDPLLEGFNASHEPKGGVQNIAMIFDAGRVEAALAFLKSLRHFSKHAVVAHLFVTADIRAHVKADKHIKASEKGVKGHGAFQVHYYDAALCTDAIRQIRPLSPHIHPAALCKIFLPDLLPESVRHVLWVDNDVVTLGSPAPCFPTFGASEYLAMAFDAGETCQEKPDECWPMSHEWTVPKGLACGANPSWAAHRKEVDPSRQCAQPGETEPVQFNAGVVGMDLAKMRQVKFTERMVKYAHHTARMLGPNKPARWGEQELLANYLRFHPEALKVLPCGCNYQWIGPRRNIKCPGQPVYIGHGWTQAVLKPRHHDRYNQLFMHFKGCDGAGCRDFSAKTAPAGLPATDWGTIGQWVSDTANDGPQAPPPALLSTLRATPTCPHQSYGCDEDLEAPLFSHDQVNVLTRTSQRPHLFKDCRASVLAQSHPRVSHLTLTDDNSSYAYLEGADVKLLVHSKYSAYDPMEPCTKCGASEEKNCANPPYGPDKARQSFLDCYCQTGFPMNKYMEKLHGQVDKGWIMYLDDDNLLLDPYGIALALIHAKSRDEVILWRFKGGRYVPHERNYGLKRVERGDIDSGNVLYHSSHASLAQWGSTRCGDFRTIDALTKQLDVRWLNRTVVGVNPLRQNEMGHGQRADVLGKLTVVITSSTAQGFRPHWLRLSVAQYLSTEYTSLVRKVVVVWNDKGPPPDLPEAVTVLRMHNASLNNRWTRVGEHVHTDAVLNLDDDVFVNKQGLICMYNWWSTHRSRLVGPFVRKHHGHGQHLEYSQDELFGRHAYSMVLPKVLMFDRTHYAKYAHLRKEVRGYVDTQKAHCDDIVLNAMDKEPPFRVLLPPASVTDYFSACTKRKELRDTTGGLGLQADREELRSECLGWIVKFFKRDLAQTSELGTCDADGAMLGVGGLKDATGADESMESTWVSMRSAVDVTSSCTEGFGRSDLLRRPW